MQNINQSLRNVIFSPKGKYLLSSGLLFTILLLFYLFQQDTISEVLTTTHIRGAATTFCTCLPIAISLACTLISLHS